MFPHMPPAPPHLHPWIKTEDANPEWDLQMEWAEEEPPASLREEGG